jgi:hypothetical protein
MGYELILKIVIVRHYTMPSNNKYCKQHQYFA